MEVPTLEGFSKITVEPGSQPNTIIKLKEKDCRDVDLEAEVINMLDWWLIFPKTKQAPKELLKELEDSFD